MWGHDVFSTNNWLGTLKLISGSVEVKLNQDEKEFIKNINHSPSQASREQKNKDMGVVAMLRVLEVMELCKIYNYFFISQLIRHYLKFIRMVSLQFCILVNL